MGVQEIFDGCPGDISSVFWRYLIDVLAIFDRVMEIFDNCNGDM